MGEGLLGMCLGEKRRLLIPEKELRNKYKEVRKRAGQCLCMCFCQILPDILGTVKTFLEAEVTVINRMWYHK